MNQILEGKNIRSVIVSNYLFEGKFPKTEVEAKEFLEKVKSTILQKFGNHSITPQDCEEYNEEEDTVLKFKPFLIKDMDWYIEDYGEDALVLVGDLPGVGNDYLLYALEDGVPTEDDCGLNGDSAVLRAVDSVISDAFPKDFSIETDTEGLSITYTLAFDEDAPEAGYTPLAITKKELEQKLGTVLIDVFNSLVKEDAFVIDRKKYGFSVDLIIDEKTVDSFFVGTVVAYQGIENNFEKHYYRACIAANTLKGARRRLSGFLPDAEMIVTNDPDISETHSSSSRGVDITISVSHIPTLSDIENAIAELKEGLINLIKSKKEYQPYLK